MARKKKKKITPIKIRKKDEADYKRLVNNAKSKIRRTKKNYGIDISSEIDIPKLENFKTRKQFNQWKEDMTKLKNRADLKFKKVGNVVASQKVILESTLETKAILNRMTKIGKNKFKAKGSSVIYSKERLMTNVLQTNVAREQQMKYKAMVKELPAFKEANKELSEKARERQLERSTGVSLTAKFRPESYRTPRELELKEEGLERSSRPNKFEEDTLQFKENFLKRNESLFGDMSDTMRELFESMSNAEFLNFYEYYKDDINLSLYASDSDSEELIDEFQRNIKRVVNDYKKTVGDIKDLENF